MTTLPATKVAGALTLSQPDLPVPPQLTATKNIPGFRNDQWVMVPVVDADLPALENTVDQLQVRLEPARPRRILEIVFALIRRHKQDRKDLSDGEWEAIAHEYVQDLGGFSEAHIMGAIGERRRVSRFMPHQSEIIAIATNQQAQDKLLLRRGQVLLGKAEPFSWERLPPPAEPTKVYDLKPALELLAGKKRVGSR